MKIALISGCNGQDGSFLAELLLSKGYEVHGIIRRSSSFNTKRIDNIFDKLHLYYGDISDPLSVDSIMQKAKFDEVYHLGAQSHVKVSFEVPFYTGQVDALGTLNMLEAMRKHCPEAKFYNAASSELYGKALEVPQNEKTPFNPQSPYGIAKMYGFYMTKNYREAYNLFAVNGVLFNHESERRGSTFVTAKVVNGIYDYVNKGKPFSLGNVYAKRDWGHAKEYVEAMWLILQQDVPDDYVIGTGETHTIKEFVDECLKNVPFPIPMWVEWRKDDLGRECLWDVAEIDNPKLIIGIDEHYFRPTEVDILLADASKAKEKLGWEPKIKFEELAEMMMKYRFNVGRI